MNLNVNEIFQYLSNAVIEYGPKLLGAILVWIIGSIIIKKFIADEIASRINTGLSVK